MSGTALPRLQRILYAEDDPDLQRIARFALERVGGFDVALCSSGIDTLRQAETFAPDLILLDLMLPGMDGQEVYRALRTLSGLAEVPVVFVTAKSNGPEIQECRQLGALDVVTKPFNPMTFAQRLRDLWTRRMSSSGIAIPLRGARPRQAI